MRNITRTAKSLRSTGACALIALGIAAAGCSPAFLGGVGVGVLGTGAQYEYTKKRELDKLDRAFERGDISKDEYLRRKNEIEKGSVIR